MKALSKWRRGWAIAEGYAQCSLSVQARNVWYLSSVRTDPNHRRQGYAKRMLKQIVRAARRLKIAVKLNVAPFYPDPLSFLETAEMYRKCGFEFTQGTEMVANGEFLS